MIIQKMKERKKEMQDGREEERGGKRKERKEEKEEGRNRWPWETHKEIRTDTYYQDKWKQDKNDKISKFHKKDSLFFSLDKTLEKQQIISNPKPHKKKSVLFICPYGTIHFNTLT